MRAFEPAPRGLAGWAENWKVGFGVTPLWLKVVDGSAIVVSGGFLLCVVSAVAACIQAGHAVLGGTGSRLTQRATEGSAGTAISAIERAALDYATEANKLQHIFAPKHNLETLVRQFGGRESAIRQILDSIKTLTPASGLFEVTTAVGGQTVVVRGAVIDGVTKIGTAFSP